MVTPSSRFQLVKKIAAGGMAEIFLAKQLGQDGFARLCAIKRILPHFAQETEFLEMFRDEAHICKRLQHANIVRIEDFEEVDGSYGLVMEFIKGCDLRTLLAACEKNRKRLPVAHTLFVIAETCRGLEYAHTKKDDLSGQALDIVHRDISPQNILVSSEGEVKVTDFGIAHAEDKITHTKPGIVKGKYSYMSPEQITGKQVDARTDVFAAGVVLWESLAMKRLFSGKNEVATISLVRSCKIPDKLTNLNPNVTPELQAIAMRALTKDPNKRYSSASAFERDLRRYLNKHFPEFTASELGSFVKRSIPERLEQVEQAIKEVFQAPEVSVSSAVGASGAGAASSTNSGHLAASSEPAEGIQQHAQGPSMVMELPNESNEDQPFQLSKVHNAQGDGTSLSASRISSSPKDREFEAGEFASQSARKLSAKTGGELEDLLRVRRQYRQNRSSWPLVLICIALAALVAYAFFKPEKQGPYTLTIQSTPEIVRMQLDGKPLFQNRYRRIQALRLRFQRGQEHTLVVQKHGYHSARFRLNGRPKQNQQKLDVVLKPRVRFAPVAIRLDGGAGTNRRVFFEISNGYAYGLLPAKINDLHYNKRHTLKVFPNEKKKSDHFFCYFTPTSNSWRAPFQVIVNISKRRCRESLL